MPTSAEYRSRRQSRREAWARDMEICGNCGLAYLNVRHRTTDERVGDPYFEEGETIPFCVFAPTGHSVTVPAGMRS